MYESVILDRVQFASVRLNQTTEWFFAEVFDSSGVRATTEFGLPKNVPKVSKCIAELVAVLAGKPLADDEAVTTAADIAPGLLTPLSITSVAVSTVRSIVTILQSIHADVRLSEKLAR